MNKKIKAYIAAYIRKCIKNSGIDVSEKMLKASIVNYGNIATLEGVIQKALSKKAITVCAFGGSITEGIGKNYPPPIEGRINDDLEEKCYFDRVCDFIEYAFSCKVNRINAGISATDTVFAIHRMQEDVVAHNPDLVIVEWCCNDGLEFPHKQATYEYMLRELLSKGIAVIMLSMSDKHGNSSQSLHEPLAKLYNIPMLSFRDAYFSNDKYEYFIADSVHPNKIGHMLTSIIIDYFLLYVYYKSDNTAVSEGSTLSVPFNKECLFYRNPRILNLKDIYNGNEEYAKIISLGSFKFTNDICKFGYRHYECLTADTSVPISPLVLEIKDIKTLYLYIYRNSTNFGSDFLVEVNGQQLESNTFTCMHGTDNNQTEWSYAWATDKILFSDTPQNIILKITPNQKNPSAKIILFSLLVS